MIFDEVNEGPNAACYVQESAEACSWVLWLMLLDSLVLCLSIINKKA